MGNPSAGGGGRKRHRHEGAAGSSKKQRGLGYHQELQDVSSLQGFYNTIVATRNSAALQRAVDEGWIRTQVGPHLLLRSKNVLPSDEEPECWWWLCHLWALLLSHEGQSGRLTSGTRQYFLEAPPKEKESPGEEKGEGEEGEDPSFVMLLPMIFQTLCDASFLDEDERNNTSTSRAAATASSSSSFDSYQRLATVCHCMTLLGLELKSDHNAAWDCALQHFKTPDYALRGSVLMDWIPQHRRELLKRQYPFLFVSTAGSSSQKKLGDDSEKSASSPHTPFLVAVVGTILKCLEGELGTSLEKAANTTRSANDGDENEMRDDDDDDDGTRNQTDKKVPQQHSTVSLFLHRSLEMLIDMLSCGGNALRIFLVLYLEALHFSIRWRRALRASDDDQDDAAANLTRRLLQRLEQLQNLPLTAVKAGKRGVALVPRTPQETLSLYYRRASTFQKMCHRYHGTDGTLDDVIFAGLGRLCGSGRHDDNDAGENRKFLEQALASLSDAQLLQLLHRLRLLDQKQPPQSVLARLYADRRFLLGVLRGYLTQPPSSTSSTNDQPLFPTEALLWDATRLPPRHAQLLLPSSVLNLPKLPAVTPFLSYADYLWRNFTLLQLATASDISSDLVNVIRRLRPVLALNRGTDEDDEDVALKEGQDLATTTTFAGWARMALELQKGTSGHGLTVVQVDKPLLGQVHSRAVFAEFTIDLEPCGAAIRQEWDALGEHDNLFLVAIDAGQATNGSAPTVAEYRARLGHTAEEDDDGGSRLVADEDDPSFPQRYGVSLVRGGTIVHIRNEKGTILTDPAAAHQQQQEEEEAEQEAEGGHDTKTSTTKLIMRVALDPIQYGKDLRQGIDYKNTINVVVRRHGRENSFKALLETTQTLLAGTDSVHRVLPTWLQPLLLGQNECVADAHYRSKSMQDYARQTVGVPSPDAFLDYGDTFLDESHLRESFVSDEKKQAVVTVDGRDKMEGDLKETPPKEKKNYKVRLTQNESGETIVDATSYRLPEADQGNPIRFTQRQVEAVRSGLSCGLTLVVGPPGTGKTDVAVQIIASLYHSFSTQRTVIVTHSNAALNDLFQKVMARGDVPERYMVRLGAGERDLQTESTHDFTKSGRVAYCWKRRAQLLEQVQRLSESLGLSGRSERGPDGSPSYTCQSADIFFQNKVQSQMAHYQKDPLKTPFPFRSYFGVGDNDALSTEAAQTHWESLVAIFDELAEYRPLELLRSQRQRTDYFLLKQARIVAMTSTHAAIARSHLLALNFEYDNLVVEEAGQMTELDTFVPLLLQKAPPSGSAVRLKRVCLLGDHNQLPPVIKNLTFARYSNMDQSMFARLVRLGVPHIQLDQQGRTRPEIANLYNWRYNNLGNLDHVLQGDRFGKANAGFGHLFQFINVDAFQGKGETTPTAYFYQNLGEAEYAVAMFQYMVMLGYPPESISILTTYQGQKELIADILGQRCGPGTPLEGVAPRAVSTVDQYQGQQNDYVLLSLVRTQAVGHLRDVRRWVVAVSRARYGLYVLGRYDLFSKHSELAPLLQPFFEENGGARHLKLVLNETFPSERAANAKLAEDAESVFEVEDVEHLGAMVHQMQQDLLEAQEATGE